MLRNQNAGPSGQSGRLCFPEARRSACRESDSLCLRKTRGTLGCFCMGDILLHPSFSLRAQSLSCALPSKLDSAPCHLDLSLPPVLELLQGPRTRRGWP